MKPAKPVHDRIQENLVITEGLISDALFKLERIHQDLYKIQRFEQLPELERIRECLVESKTDLQRLNSS